MTGTHEALSTRRRLLLVLAGFFGLAVTATLSAVPEQGVAEVIRAGATASAPAAVRPHQPDERPRHTAHASEHACIKPPAALSAPDRCRVLAKTRHIAPPSVRPSTAPVRGPPSDTGSDVPSH
ncbi:hypothetical protein [Actinomadura hibisca]|uniref:hypothetical protein n=1 Tax=Actinomadura hibisca TaxID=68565 RepID=UPI0008332AB3|nr:hypothetical protein [Actinomadura hibisca]